MPANARLVRHVGRLHRHQLRQHSTTPGAYVEWTIMAPAAGSYALEFRYANGAATDRNLEIKVGTTVVNGALAFTPTATGPRGRRRPSPPRWPPAPTRSARRPPASTVPTWT